MVLGGMRRRAARSLQSPFDRQGTKTGLPTSQINRFGSDVMLKVKSLHDDLAIFHNVDENAIVERNELHYLILRRPLSRASPRNGLGRLRPQ